MPAVAIDAPDDTMLSTLLVKLFADRQLAVDDAIVRYAVARMERSFEAARQLVDSIDRIMLAEQRRPNLAMVRAILADEPDD
jgi:chromosomal replication initiation ATPase DnaA